MYEIEVGDRGIFRMWNSAAYTVTGTVAEIRINQSGDTRILFKRDGYRATFNVPAEHFRQWFTPFTAENFVKRQFPTTYQECAK